MNDRMTQQPAGDGTTQNNQSLSRQSQQQGMTNQDTNYQGYNQDDSSPFALMRRFSEDVDRMFSAFGFGSFGNFGSMNRQLDRTGRNRGGSTLWGQSAVSPTVNVFTRGDDLVVSADLPGIKPDDINVDIQGNNLVIQGQSRSQNENKGDRGYWYSERSYGSFYRSIPLPAGVPSDGATAQYDNGVLEVTLPGAARSVQQSRRIPIQGASGRQSDSPRIHMGTGNTATQSNTNTQDASSSDTRNTTNMDSQQQQHNHQ